MIIPGTKFNKWTVLKYVGVSKRNQLLYECQCACGRKGILEATVLKNAKSGQCRVCGKKEQTKAYQMLQKRDSFINEHRRRSWERI